jgi:8-oxo-dGTP diphosphatase
MGATGAEQTGAARAMWESQVAFCPLCGAQVANAELHGRSRRRCVGCGFVIYLNPASASAALVVRGHEVLLVRRGIEPFKGWWGLPAGYQEYDETPEETVIRETREETGLEVAIERLFAVCYTRDDPRKRANLVAYLCREVGGELMAGDDAVEAGWFPLHALPPDIAFANNRLLLSRLVAERTRES